MAAIPKIPVNPFRPGAGHMPPYLAGRVPERREFERLLEQDPILSNLVLTGLRGVGKTVLLETFKPIAIDAGWIWVGTDMSESTSISEENIAIRLFTDLSLVTSGVTLSTELRPRMGFGAHHKDEVRRTLRFDTLVDLYRTTPGLVADKIKYVLEIVWSCLSQGSKKGVIFAYDEAQTLADHAAKEQFPLSLLLDVFQSIQKKNIRFMLLLTGLPTLFPKLVEARTFSERMFRVMFLDRLNEEATRQAILVPIKEAGCPVRFTEETVDMFWDKSGGYPYFIQFFCREAFDLFIQQQDSRHELGVPMAEIHRKLDSDFFAGRWSRATDRQRELLCVVALLPHSDREFTVQDVVEASSTLPKPFGPTNVHQMLTALQDAGLVYKNRHGKYSFAVPLMHLFIQRQTGAADALA